tara:strand:+ start:2297 stop:2533 length:237 start_codon:yes stop_codon:yes gene_type:complete
MAKVKNKIKETSTSIIVNGVEYKPYKRSKQVFIEHQQENLEDCNRKHVAFLNDTMSVEEFEAMAELQMELQNDIKRGK